MHVDRLKIRNGKILIIWEGKLLHPQYDDNSEGSKSLHSDHESSPTQDHSDTESELWTGRTHTIPFKVIGCTKETRRT